MTKTWVRENKNKIANKQIQGDKTHILLYLSQSYAI